MEEVVLVVLLVVLPVVIAVFVLPIVAMVKASGAKRRMLDAHRRIDSLERQVVELRQSIRAPSEAKRPDRASPSPPAAETGATGATTESDAKMGESSLPADGRLEIDMSSTRHAVQSQAEVPTQRVGEKAEPPQADGDPPLPPDAPAPRQPRFEESGPDETVDGDGDRDVSSEPADEDTPPSGPPPTSIEERIGMVWFTRIGALVGMVVAGWFFKYMVDNNWIGPWGRIAIGAVVGVVILGIGEVLFRRRRTHAVFNHGMLGLGLAVLLITAYASFGFYHLVPVTAAFGVIALLTVFGGALSHFHRSEPILVFSLVAVFLNPVMLSTGQDRPLALFSYLLILTSGAMVVAVRHGFRLAAWAGVAGTTVLFIGWYTQFFDVRPPPPPGIIDAFPDELRGAYYGLSSRLVPLIVAVLFPASWAGSGHFFEKRRHAATATLLMVVAATAAHGAMSALLYDRPVVLGGALLGLGALASAMLIWKQRSDWLGLPMLLSFSVLAGLTGRIEDDQLLGVMIVTGGLSLFYFGVFFRTAMQQGKLDSPLSRGLIGGAGAGLFFLALLWMMPDHFELFGVLTVLLAASYLVIAALLGSRVMMLATFVIGIIGMSVASTECRAVQTPFLVISGAWFATHVGTVAFDVFVRKNRWSRPHLFVLAGAGAGFIALFLQSTPSDGGTLRSLLSLAAGIVYLGIGVRSNRGDASNRPLLPLGMALVFFTLALAFLLSGASLTVAWAVEAAVLAYLTARVRNNDDDGTHWWLLAGLAVFFAALVHLLAVDIHWLAEQRSDFLGSGGRAGVLLPAPFRHPRAIGLLAMGACLLFAAMVFARARGTLMLRVSAAGLMIAGHAALLVLFITEMRLVFTDAPAIPAGIAKDELITLYRAYQADLAGIETRLATVTTVVMGIYAALVLILGFVLREVWHRRLGLMLFMLTLVKLSLFDIWAFETLYKIIVGGAVAFLLLLSGFLYARFGGRLKEMVADDSKLMSGLVIIGVLTASGTGHALEGDAYQFARAIAGIDTSGEYIVEVDAPLYRASQTDGLNDLRIVDGAGREVPYFILEATSSGPVSDRAPRVFDSVVKADNTTEAIIDLGEAVMPHVAVRLTIRGGDFMRRARVASSRDGQSFGVLADGLYVYSLPAGAGRAERTLLEYPDSQARYLKVTLSGGDDDERLAVTGASLFLASEPPVATEIRETVIPLDGTPVTQDKKTMVPLGPIPPRVPFQKVALEIDTSEFVRRVKVETTTNQQAWFGIGAGEIFRIRRSLGDELKVIEHLAIDVSQTDRPHWRLVIDNGDNPPLEVTGVRALYRPRHVVFRTAMPGAHTLLVGKEDDDAPRYELASLVKKGSLTHYRPARLGDLVPNPEYGKVERHKPVPWTERHARLIQLLAGGVIVLLLLWTIRLLLKAKGNAG